MFLRRLRTVSSEQWWPADHVDQRSSSRSVSPPRRGARHTRSRSPSDTPALTSSEREARRSYWLNQVTPEQRLSLEPVLEKIRRDGSNYLNALKEAEKDNVRFAFLLDDKVENWS